MTCDFIAYAFVPSATCYLLPYQLLRRAWNEHKREWWSEYGQKRADNGSYVTVSVPVPIDVVLAAITDAMVIRWTAVAA